MSALLRRRCYGQKSEIITMAVADDEALPFTTRLYTTRQNFTYCQIPPHCREYGRGKTLSLRAEKNIIPYVGANGVTESWSETRTVVGNKSRLELSHLSHVRDRLSSWMETCRASRAKAAPCLEMCFPFAFTILEVRNVYYTLTVNVGVFWAATSLCH